LVRFVPVERRLISFGDGSLHFITFGRLTRRFRALFSRGTRSSARDAGAPISRTLSSARTRDANLPGSITSEDARVAGPIRRLLPDAERAPGRTSASARIAAREPTIDRHA
jgi:hypothetical protein